MLSRVLDMYVGLLLVAGFAGTVVVAGALVAGCTNDCVKGRSVVILTVPTGPGWVLEEYCIDDECLAVDERQFIGSGEPLFYSYYIDVRDRPDTYHYRVKLTPPDGRSLVYDGEVETKGNKRGGERCKPTSVSAGLNVGSNGRLTTQSP